MVNRGLHNGANKLYRGKGKNGGVRTTVPIQLLLCHTTGDTSTRQLWHKNVLENLLTRSF